MLAVIILVLLMYVCFIYVMARLIEKWTDKSLWWDQEEEKQDMYKVEFIGNLGQDAEVRTYGDREVTSFRVAVNEYSRGQDTTTWITVYKDGLRIAQHLKKGARVFVRGNQRLSTYMKDGQMRQSIDVYANEVEILNKGEQTPQNLQEVANKLEGVL